MGKYAVLIVVLLNACSAFQQRSSVPEEAPQPSAKEEHKEKPESRMDKAYKAQNRAILRKVIGLASNFQKPAKGFTQKPDQAKLFTYSTKFRSFNREGAINFEIKPENDKYRFSCKIVIETPSQEETLDFTSLDAAEIIRQIKIVLGDDGYADS